MLPKVKNINTKNNDIKKIYVKNINIKSLRGITSNFPNPIDLT